MTNAVVTLLFTASYLPGALVLGRALKQLGLPSETDLVVLLATQLTPFEQALLDDVYDTVLETSLIHAQNTPQLALLGRPELKPTFSKAQLFALTQYSTVVYLDSDTLPLKPLDDLFELNLRTDQVAASPDCGWPDIFNSGVLVLKPDLDVYGSLLERTQAENSSFDGADQGLLNQFFNVGKPDGWVRLPFLYNVTPSGQYQYQPAYEFFDQEVKVVHYIGATKPWASPWDTGALRDRWWAKYSEFYGWDRDVKKTIHGIEPRYYQAEPVVVPEEKALLPEPVPWEAQQSSLEVEQDEVGPPQQDDQEEHYDQEVLLNPESYENFVTIEQNHQWNPAYEEPPKDGRPEAAYFPSDLHYNNQWDESQGERNNGYESAKEEVEDALEEAALEEEYSAPEPEWTAPAVFPWEVENRRAEPERVFDNGGSFTFDNPWESLPLIQKIKDMKIEEANKQLEEDKEKGELERDEDEIKRLKEIEDRYTGSIEDQDVLDVIVEKFEAEEETIVKEGAPEEEDDHEHLYSDPEILEDTLELIQDA